MFHVPAHKNVVAPAAQIAAVSFNLLGNPDVDKPPVWSPEIRWHNPEHHDFIYRDCGSVCLLAPQSDDARIWVAEHISSGAQYFGRSVVIERRFVADILAGIDEDGLVIH